MKVSDKSNFMTPFSLLVTQNIIDNQLLLITNLHYLTEPKKDQLYSFYEFDKPNKHILSKWGPFDKVKSILKMLLVS